jgi:hypothetical protein
MASDMDEWLRDLAPPEEDDELEAVEVAEAPPDAEDVGGLDLMDDLRGQFVGDEDVVEVEDERRERRGLNLNVSLQQLNLGLGLLPWQQFVLSLLLFLDIAVIGVLFLVMLGRVVIPAG